MLFRGLIHNKQAMCYSSQKEGHEDRKLFFLLKYEKYILPSRTNQLMTSRAPASPRAARSWHLELAQSRQCCCLPCLPEKAGIWNSLGSFLLSIGDRGYYGLSKSYPRKPQTLQHVASQASPSEPPRAQSFIHLFFIQGLFY